MTEPTDERSARREEARRPGAHILVVDDDPLVQLSLTRLLTRVGYQVEGAESTETALARLGKRRFDAVVSDLYMPRVDGLGLLDRVRELAAGTPVIMFTAYADTRNAVDAVRRGAFDFLSKSARPKEVLATIESALVSTAGQARRAPPGAPACMESCGLAGLSPQIARIRDLVRAVSQNRCNVLIQGESGTGKELVARGIHATGPAKNRPFMVVNCAALHRDLLESQLFGHRKGSFTGASSDQTGLFRAAEGGTLFLDEIGELPLDLQSKLLRALQEREILPIGSTEPVKVNVRFLAATNKNLREAVDAGLFREDLFFRLDVVRLEIPPLRERLADLPDLVACFVARFAAEYGVPPKQLEPEALLSMQAYGWPGNIRELQNAIERAYAISSGPWLHLEDLPNAVRAARPVPPRAGAAPESAPLAELPMQTLEESKRAAVTRALLTSGGNKKRAAELLGIPRQRLYRLMERYGFGGDGARDCNRRHGRGASNEED